MKKLFSIIGILAFIVSTNSFAQFFGPKDLIQLESYLSYDKVYSSSEVKLALDVSVKEGWHINSNTPKEDFLIASEVKVNEPFKLTKVIFPEAEDLNFEFSDVPVSVFEGEFKIGGKIEIPSDIQPGEYELIVTLGYQACNNSSCLPPNEISDTLRVQVVDQSQGIMEINSDKFAGIVFEEKIENQPEESSLADILESSGLFFSLLFVFLGGLALNLTPCVYPLIPITIGYFGGQSEGSTKRLAMLGLLYVLGIALTYSIVGVVTSLTGAVFGSLLQNPYVIGFIVIVFITLALSQFGVYEFKLPDSWVMKAGGAKSGAFGAFFMGLTMGIVAAPCIGPFVLGLVTVVAAKGDALYGFLMFFFLAIGLGLPYLFLAIFSGKIKSLPNAGVWMEGVKHIFGWILFAAAIYFVQPLLPKEFSTYALPVFGIIGALYLLFIDKTGNEVKGFFYFKIVFTLLVLGLSVWTIIPTEESSPEWTKFEQTKFEQSLSNGNKVIMDFYADWCIPCKELDKFTFSDPRVISALKNYDKYKIDMTKTMSDRTEKIRKKFNILGMPTIIIYNSSGIEAERLTGFVDADQFLKILNKIK